MRRSAPLLASLTISVRCTIRSALARADSTISSASRRALARYSSLSRSIQRARRRSSGRRSSASSSSSATSSRLIRAEADRGMDLAFMTRSRTRRIRTSASRPSPSSHGLMAGPSPSSPSPPTHWWGNRSFSRMATGGGTRAVTSPPNRATSRSSLEARNEWVELVNMNRVSIPDRCWVIWISFSKSETALSPFTRTVAPTSLASSTTRPVMATILTPGRSPSDSSSICLRSDRGKSGSPFWGLRTAATTSSSNRREARSTISRCPLCRGSKEPGNKAVVTRGLSGGCVDLSIWRSHHRTATRRRGPIPGVGGSGSGRPPSWARSGPEQRDGGGPVGPRPEDPPAGGPRDGAARLGDHQAHPCSCEQVQEPAPLPEPIGRVADGQIEASRPGQALPALVALLPGPGSGGRPPCQRPQPGHDIGLHDPGSARGAIEDRQVGADDLHGPPVPVHEGRRSRPPRQGLHPHGPAPGEQVGHHGALNGIPAGQHVEDRLPDPFPGRPGQGARRRPEPPAPGRASDHPHGELPLLVPWVPADQEG